MLRAHLARPNPQWKRLDAGAEALVIFPGVDRYVTPGWYPTKQETGKVVPTWNYVTVEVRGPARVIDDAQWLRASRLADWSAWRRRAPSRGPSRMRRRLSSPASCGRSSGSRSRSRALIGKFKLSQNRDEADRRGGDGPALSRRRRRRAMAALIADREGLSVAGKADPNLKVAADNRKARYNYEIGETSRPASC